MIHDFMTLKVLASIAILVISVVSGLFPFLKRLKTDAKYDFPMGQALAAGIFLGAGLVHLLADANDGFNRLGYHYPIASLLAGTLFLGLLFLEHIGREVYQHDGADSAQFAVLACLMLSFHSLLEGAALGLAGSWSLSFMLFLAIVAHKWAASFALAVQINRSSLRMSVGVGLFILFAVMTPLGILVGALVTTQLSTLPILSPIFNALAAGTFLYLGTLHGLSRAVMVEQCCNLRNYMLVIVGFSIMAVVAIWT